MRRCKAIIDAAKMKNLLVEGSAGFVSVSGITSVAYRIPPISRICLEAWYPREKPRSISVEKRKHNFEEVELSWNESVAIRQCRRCLRCDYGKVAGPLVDIAEQVVSEEEVHA